MTDTCNGILLLFLKKERNSDVPHTQINLKTMLSEVSHKRTNNVRIHLEQAPKVVKSHRDGKLLNDSCQCWGCVDRTYYLMGTESHFGTVNFWRQTVAIFAQQREYIL